MVPDSVFFSLQNGWMWQCGVRNTKLYAECTAKVVYCGDDQIHKGEMCDDGNTIDNDACTNTCKENICGDGIIFA